MSPIRYCLAICLTGLLLFPAVASAQVPSFPHKSGTLVRDNGTIYKIYKGYKRGFPSLNELLSYNYRLSRIVPANDGDRQLVEGPPMRARAGTFVLDTSDGRTIYLIGKNGEKQGFSNPIAFIKKKKRNTVVWPIDLSGYPVGDIIE